jgi:quercetin dioxygenase-like cupin family protein
MHRSCALFLGIVVCFAITPRAEDAAAQQASSRAQEPGNHAFSGSKAIPVLVDDVTGAPNKRVIANVYEVQVGSVVPRHFHHGDEFHFVLSGEWAAEVEGRPTKNLKAGEGQYVENGRWHGGKVVGNEPLRLLGIMIVDKGQPITTLVKQ